MRNLSFDSLSGDAVVAAAVVGAILRQVDWYLFDLMWNFLEFRDFFFSIDDEEEMSKTYVGNERDELRGVLVENREVRYHCRVDCRANHVCKENNIFFIDKVHLIYYQWKLMLVC